MHRLIFLPLLLYAATVLAGAQVEEPLSPAARLALQRAVSQSDSLRLAFSSPAKAEAWVSEMSRRLRKHIPDDFMRLRFLKTLHYEATRAGLDPQLVLGLIQVESAFNKYAISSAGARGYMQVMPFWIKQIGNKGDDLFEMQTNLRFGCTILRYYLDMEKGNLFRALGRYNGSLGQAWYPKRVLAAWRKAWAYPAADATAQAKADHPG